MSTANRIAITAYLLIQLGASLVLLDCQSVAAAQVRTKLDMSAKYSAESRGLNVIIMSAYNFKDDGSGIGLSKITTKLRGRLYTQYLRIPAGTWPACDPEDHPAAFIWRTHCDTILVTVVNTHPSADMGYRAVLLYQLHSGKWCLVRYNPDLTLFSDRGGFYTHAETLFVWDRTIDWNTYMSANAIFKLREYKWKDGRISGPQILFTKRKYFGGDEPKPDPLCEFGLAWKHWGT
jgi:hypothetical protein